MRRNRLLRHLLLPALTLFLGGSAGWAETFTLSGADPVIYNLIGEISLSGGSSGPVTVDVTRGGTGGSRLTFNSSPDRLAVVFPGDDFVYRKGLGWGGSSTFQVNDDGTFGRGTGGRSVTVRGMGSGLEVFADLKVTLPRGKKLQLNLGVGKIQIENAEGELKFTTLAGDVEAAGFKGPLSGNSGSGDLVLSRIDGAVELNTGSGDITLSALNGDGEFHTGSGDVRLEALKGAAVTAETGSGDISLHRVEAGKVVLRTGSGDIEAAGARSADLTLETGSGDITADIDAGAPEIAARTGSGEVRLAFSPGLNARIEIAVGSGDMDVAIPTSETKQKKHEFTGIAGSGKGRVRVETGSGDVSLTSGRPPAEKRP